jgi:hypothetical protein
MMTENHAHVKPGIKSMKKTLQTLAAFLSFVFVLSGAVLIARSLEIVSRPFDVNLPTWQVYYLELNRLVVEFYIGCGMVSAGLTFFWIQRRK